MRKLNFKIKISHIIISLFFIFVIFTYFNSFENTENNLEDLLYQTREPVDSRIVIIGIDDESLDKLGRWPWKRKYFAEFLNVLDKGNPAVVSFDILFAEEMDKEEDLYLAKAIKDFNSPVILASFGEFDKRTEDSKVKVLNYIEPIDILKKESATAHINTIRDKDSVVRRTLLYYKYEGNTIYSFAWKTYEKYMKHMGLKADINKLPLNKFDFMHIDFTGRPGDYEKIPFYMILNGDIPAEYFQDKIVLVGPYALGIDDYIITPLDHNEIMFGIEAHANIIQNLLNGDFKQDVRDYINFIPLIVFAMISIYVFNRLSPGRALIILLIGSAAYLMTAQYLYKKGFIIHILYPIVFFILSYLINLAYKYIEELFERKRITGVFGKYVAPQIVNQILREGENALRLGGARREITVLFVDIRGFTPLSESAQPEEVVEILNDYLNLCASSIFKYEGTLDKFIGDATMAIFNAPLDLDNHELRALKTAWKMKKGSEAMKKRLEERFGKAVQFGIGVNTGPAIVGNIGADFRMDYTAIGDTVNTAARLESNAKPGQILMSSETYERVKDKITAKCLGTIKVKGKTEGILVYELEGVNDEDEND